MERFNDCPIGSCSRHGQCMYAPCRSSTDARALRNAVIRKVHDRAGVPEASDRKTDDTVDHAATHEQQREAYDAALDNLRYKRLLNVTIGSRRSGKTHALAQRRADRLIMLLERINLSQPLGPGYHAEMLSIARELKEYL